MARRKVRINDGTEANDVFSYRWYNKDENTSDLVQVGRRLEMDQEWRKMAAVVYASLYANQKLASIYHYGVMTAAGGVMPLDHIGNRVSFNVIQSAVSTITSKFAKQKTRLLYLTKGGDANLQRKAQLLTKFTDGLFYMTRFYEFTESAVRDCGVFGSGPVKISPDERKAEVKLERVLPTDVYVNEEEIIHGYPRTMYQRMYLHREVLADTYSDNKKQRQKILDAPGVRLGRAGSRGSDYSDMLAVWEAWHLGVGDVKGRHAIAVDDIELLDEEYTKDYHPIIKLDWEFPLIGYWGRGIAELLTGTQIEINHILRVIQKGHRGLVPRFMVEKGAEVSPTHLNDEVWSIVKYTLNRPDIVKGEAFTAEIYQHLERLKNWAYEQVGISQLAAASAKPAGLNSGAAIREHKDVESERHVAFGQQIERFTMDVARVMIDIARDLYEDNPQMQVKAPGTKLLEAIKWKDINLDEDQYEMQVYPTSLLPTTPAGKLATVTEMLDKGLIPKEHALKLLSFPDVEAVVSLETAAYDDVQRVIADILDKGKYEPPDDIMTVNQLVQAGKLVLAAYHKAKNDDVPEKRREMLLRYLDEVRALLEEKQPPQPAGPPMGAEPPPEMGGGLQPPGAGPPIPQ